MVDTRTKEQRRRIMQSVGTKDTGPEILVRRLLHSLGYRYRLNDRLLPGKPDIVFRSRRKAIFVHGCFWHGHGCSKGKLPKSRIEYWGPKIDANRTRDRAVVERLQDLGWGCLTVWQCEVADTEALKARLVSFLGETPKNRST
ncbi:MAG: very short patch repair endonuclease [Rhodoblastus sp.]